MYREQIPNDDSTFSEIILTLGIMGVLSLTFIILNFVSADPQKIANAKLAQTDMAIQKWAKNLYIPNETGFSKHNFIANQEDLMKSIEENLTEKTLREIAIKKLSLRKTEKPNEILLENGVKLTAKYIPNATEPPYCTTETACAIITTSIEAKLDDNSIKTFTSEYALTAGGLKNSKEIYKDWQEISISPVLFDSEIKYYYCLNNSCKETGCTSKTYRKCNLAPKECQTGNCTNIYITNPTYSKCKKENETGVIENRKIATMVGGIRPFITNKCCDAPQVFQEFDILKNKVCVCPNYGTIPLINGNIYASESETCEIPCPEGTFATYSRKESRCKLCDAGKYCPNKATTKDGQFICPKGSYCPEKGEKDDIRFCDITYRTSQDGSILKGGLINKINCGKGEYCPSEKLTEPKICPKGSYCPEEGLIEPIKCPKGTYSKELGAKDASTCKPCPQNTFADIAGSTSCTPCFLGTYTPKETVNSSIGAEKCIGCPPGSFYDTTIEGCKLCEAGTFQDKGSQLKCEPCKAGTFTNKINSTKCEPCPKGTCSETTNQNKEIGATKCVPCE